MSLQRKPLVSIVVVTYNAAEFVIDTLESARIQTYENLELIICDDGSKDKTVEIINNWVLVNQTRFKRVRVIAVEENTGTASNCNRGIKEANGEWIKLIAGDDIILETGISDYLEHISNSPEKIRFLHSDSFYYKDYFTQKNFHYWRKIKGELLSKKNCTAKYQHKIIQWAPSVNTPSIFFEKKLYVDLNYYDESIRSMEDWPMWLKITGNGVKIHGLFKPTTGYRLNTNSVSNLSIDKKIFSDIYLKLFEFESKYIYDDIGILDKTIKKLEYNTLRIFDLTGLNKNKLFNKILFKGVMLPFELYVRIRAYIFSIIY